VHELTFTVMGDGAATSLTLSIDQAVIAGWTGRDPVARVKHIAELGAVGIARPAPTPIYTLLLGGSVSCLYEPACVPPHVSPRAGDPQG
jgi:hypothetical protein